MNQNRNLFQLIKSLNKVEKSYFKKQSKVHGNTDNNYISLFEEFSKMKEFDNKVLSERLKKHDFHNYTPRINNYLYNQILKSLRLYNGESTTADRVATQIKNIQILFEKGHYKQCLLKLEKVKKLAYNYELWSAILDVLTLERRIISKEIKSTEYETFQQESFMERKRVLEIQLNAYEYEYFYDQVIILIKQKQKATSPQLAEKYNNILENDLFKSEDKALSHQARILYYFVVSGYYFFTNQLEETYKLVKKRMEVIESKPHFIKEDPNAYIKVLSNLLTLHNVTICSGLNLMSNDEFDGHLEKLQAIKTNSTELHAKILITAVVHQLGYYLNNGQFDEAAIYIKKVGESVEKHKAHISAVNYAVYNYLLAHMHLGIKEYSKALFHINILLDSKIKLREDMLSFARILNIVIHFELKNYLHLTYANRSTYQYLLRKERLFPFEKLILKFMRKINYDIETNKRQLKDDLLALKQELTIFLKENKASANDEIFHFIAWIDSKTKGISMGEAIRENLKQKAFNT